MNNSLNRLIDGIIIALEREIIPRVDDAYARGQAFAVMDLLRNMRPRLESRDRFSSCLFGTRSLLGKCASPKTVLSGAVLQPLLSDVPVSHDPNKLIYLGSANSDPVPGLHGKALAVTLALLKLNAVVGLTGFFNSSGTLKSVGLQCALCHSTVDNSNPALCAGQITPNPGTGCIGHRLDGWNAVFTETLRIPRGDWCWHSASGNVQANGAWPSKDHHESSHDRHHCARALARLWRS